MLGIFPAVQPLIAQVLVIAIIAAGYWYNVRLKNMQG
jgi:hypothetical protein